MGSASFELVWPFVSPRREWLKVCAAMLTGALLAFLIVILAAQIFSKQTPLALSLHEHAGQLRIGWSREAAQGATLEILDGTRRTTMVVAAPLSDVTYAVDSSDVQVRLTSDEGQTEVARYLVREPPVAQLEAEFAAVLNEALALQEVVSQQNRHISDLESEARTLNVRTTTSIKPAIKVNKAVPVTTRWWR